MMNISDQLLNIQEPGSKMILGRIIMAARKSNFFVPLTQLEDGSDWTNTFKFNFKLKNLMVAMHQSSSKFNTHTSRTQSS